MKTRILATFVSIFLFGFSACSPLPLFVNASVKPTPPKPLTWDIDPNIRIVLATFCCDGPITEELVRPYIPEAQVWGDGRFVWTEQNANGVRQVMVRQLTSDEMTELLDEIAVSGFFNWEEQYVSEPVVDAASKCLTVTITNLTKEVCAKVDGATDAFYALFDWLSQGADMSGRQFWPERAYLTGFQLAETVTSSPEPGGAWSEILKNVSADDAIAGFWLEEGEALRILWEATNQDLYHMPIVQEGDIRYRVILQIPGVSWIEP